MRGYLVLALTMTLVLDCLFMMRRALYGCVVDAVLYVEVEDAVK